MRIERNIKCGCEKSIIKLEDWLIYDSQDDNKKKFVEMNDIKPLKMWIDDDYEIQKMKLVD